MTLEEIGESLGVMRDPSEAYCMFVQRVGNACLESDEDTLSLRDIHKPIVSALVRELTEQRALNVGIVGENAGLKRQLEEARSGPYGRRTRAIATDESRDPAKTFHYDLDPRARVVIRNGAYVLTIAPESDE